MKLKLLLLITLSLFMTSCVGQSLDTIDIKIKNDTEITNNSISRIDVTINDKRILLNQSYNATNLLQEIKTYLETYEEEGTLQCTFNRTSNNLDFDQSIGKLSKIFLEPMNDEIKQCIYNKLMPGQFHNSYNVFNDLHGRWWIIYIQCRNIIRKINIRNNQIDYPCEHLERFNRSNRFPKISKQIFDYEFTDRITRITTYDYDIKSTEEYQELDFIQKYNEQCK